MNIENISVLALLFLITQSGCEKKHFPLSQPCECSNDSRTLCTEDYRTIVMTIKDEAGVPVILDEYYVLDLSTQQKVIHTSMLTNPKAGTYLLLEDNHKSLTDLCGNDFQFVGIKQEKIIVETTLKIGQDCCHIHLMKGSTQVTVK